MAVSKFELKIRYELFMIVVGMLADRLKPFEIRKPFAKFLSDLKMRMELLLM